MKRLLSFFSAGLLILTLNSCASLEELYTPTSASLAPTAAKQFTEYKSKIKVSKSTKHNAQLNRVAKRITSVVDLPGAKWEFVVFEDSTPNAFAMPGGKIGVHTGIFQITQNDAGLAAVIGHELAHVTKNHVGKQQARSTSLLGAGILGEVIMANKDTSAATRNTVRAAYTPLASILGVLPYSRSHELESDTVGLHYMAQAGYDPREAMKFWQRFAAYKSKSGSGTPEWLSTHPIDATRIANIERNLDATMAIYNRNR